MLTANFRSLSAGWFDSPTYFIRWQECEITLYIFRRIKVRFPYEFDQYIETMLEDGEMGVNPKLLHFLNYLM